MVFVTDADIVLSGATEPGVPPAASFTMTTGMLPSSKTSDVALDVGLGLQSLVLILDSEVFLLALVSVSD